jgi:hypothetical protein
MPEKNIQDNDEKIMSKLEDVDLTERIWGDYKKAKIHSGDWRTEAEEDYNFVAGHQWDEEDIAKMSEKDRIPVTFNRVGTIISAVLGIEANQRTEASFIARETSDTGLSEAINETGKWLRDYGNTDMEEAESFEDLTICGMGWGEARMDYEVDLDGKFIEDRMFPLEMFWDPAARKRNLSDARWVAHAKKMKKSEILELWPDANITDDHDEVLESANTGIHHIDPGNRYDDQGLGDESKTTDGLTVLQYQWYESTPIYRAQDPNTGKIVELTIKEFADAQEILDAGGAQYVKQRKRTYHQAFVVGSELLEKGKCPSQRGFTFKCMTGKRDHIGKQWYGLVRVMKDPARWSNKFFSQIMDIMDSNAKGGLIVEEDVFVDQRSAEEEWSSVDSITMVKKGSIANGRLIPKPVAVYPQGLDRLMQFAVSSIREVVGINLEVLGMADRQQPGVLEETRKRSAYTILATLFDSLRFYRKDTGLLMLEFIKEYIPARRIASVLKDEYKQYVPAIKNIDLQSTDIIVTEAPQSENNKNITWAFITQIAPMLMRQGISIPPEILDYSPLPASLVEKWKAELKKGPSPEQQQAEQRDVAEQQAKIRESETEAMDNIADAEYSKARAQAIIIEAMNPQVSRR